MMSNYFANRKALIPLVFLCIVLCVSACGKNIPGSPAASTGWRDVPVGSGTAPEPGTDGKPAPQPDGHYESMVASNGIDYAGSDNGRLYALNGRDGAVRWQYNAGAPVYVGAVIQGVVYADASNGNSATVFALNASNGSALWHYAVSDYVSNLLVKDGIVYIGTAATGNMVHLYALQAARGSLLWSYSARAATPGLLTASDGMVFYAEIPNIAGGSFNEYVTTLRSSDGSVAWRLPITAADGFSRGTPAIVNGVVYISTNNGSVYAVRINDGTVLWHVARSGGFNFIPLDMSPLFDNGVLFVEGKQGPAGENVVLFAMRASDETLVWSKALGFAPGPLVDQPQVVNGVMYVVNGINGFVALRETDGSLLWQHTTDQVYGHFVIANGLVHINSGDGVLALHVNDGTVAWKSAIASLDSVSSAGPAEVVDAGIVYIATTKGVIYALDASNGHTLWRYVIQELAVPTEPVYAAYAQFASTISYPQALRLITDLGLQTYTTCTFQWKPQGNTDTFSSDHGLLITSTMNAAPLWFNRLQTTRGVTHLQIIGGFISCPFAARDPSVPDLLGYNAPVTYVRATFSSSIGYDVALDAIDNLGFRLATPCYEQARSRGDKPTWNADGQENTFGSSHTLLLATTSSNATIWLAQLKALGGITSVDAPLKVTC